MKKLILFAMSIAVLGTANAQPAETKNTVKENPVLIGNQRGLTVSKGDLVLSPVLQMPEENKNYRITSYEISYVPKGKGSEVQGPFVIKSDNIATGKAADILNKAQPGDRIFLENIVAVSDDKTKQPMKLNAAVKIE